MRSSFFEKVGGCFYFSVYVHLSHKRRTLWVYINHANNVHEINLYHSIALFSVYVGNYQHGWIRTRRYVDNCAMPPGHGGDCKQYFNPPGSLQKMF
jgi:hypothetical protein